MKKIIIVLSSILTLVLVLLLLVPVLYPVDQLKPKIEEAIHAKVRGKVQLGSISLHAFPSLKLKIESITIHAPAPFEKETLANIGALNFEMPLLSLLGSPKIILVVEGAHVDLIQKGAQSNWNAFLPASDLNSTPPPSAKNSQEPAAFGETLSALPSFVASRVKAARLSLKLRDSFVQLKDWNAPKGNKIEVSQLDLSLLNMGISTPIDFEFGALIDFQSASMILKGPSSARGQVVFSPEGKNNKLNIDFHADEGKLDIRLKPFFHKPADTAMNMNLKGTLVQGPVTDLNLESLELQFAELIAKGNLKLSNATAANKKESRLNLGLNVDNIQLAPFGAFIPMVKEFKLGGNAGLKLLVGGSLEDPELNLNINLSKVTGSTPQLKHPITNLNGQIKISGTTKNPSISIDPFSLKIASSDLAVRIHSTGLDSISSNVNLSSKRLNLDELMGLTPLQVGEANSTPVNASGGVAPVKAGSLDESLDALAPTVEEALKNPMLDKMKASVNIDFVSIRALGADFNNGKFSMNYGGRELKISKTGIGAYSGRLNLEGQLSLNPKLMAYDFQASLLGVKVQDMILAHAAQWKDMLSGSMNGDFKISGRGLRKKQVAENLKGVLKGDLKEGRLNMPLVKIVGGLMDKLPSVGGKKIELPNKKQSFKGEFKTLKLISALQGRNIQLQDLDILYNTMDLGIGDMRFKAVGSLNFDRQVDMTGTAFLNPQYVKADILKGPSGQIEIPLKVQGDMSDPKPDYAYTLKVLTPRLAQGALKSQVSQKVLGDIQKNAPAPVKQGIDALKKKFGF